MLTQDRAPVRINLEKLGWRRGQFEGFNIFGIQLRNPAGVVSWKINMWNGHGDADYWITGNEFRLVGTHILDPRANGATTYEIGPVADVPEVERNAVEAALMFWRENSPSSEALADESELS